MMTEDITKDDVFLILGISNGGLFLARQICRLLPNATIYAIGAPDDIGQYSNAIDGFYPASSEDETMIRINDVIAAVNGVKLRAFMCSNPMLECIVLHHPEVFEKLEFENPFDLYRRIVDKEEVDRLCRSLKITRPEEFGLNDFSDVHIRFPVVVKPLEKSKTKGASKCAFLNTQDELKAYIAKLSRLGIDLKNVVCQQFVRGDNRWEYGYGGFFKDGRPLIDIIFHQFIQVPQGLCCYCREMTNSSLRREILEMVQPFFEKTRYSGFLEFDIKQDEETKELYVLDINPRPWRSVDMLAGKLGDSTVFSPEALDNKVVWRYPYRELFRRKNRKNVPYKLCKLIASGHAMTQRALDDKTDRAPYQIQRGKDRRELLKLIGQKFFK